MKHDTEKILIWTENKSNICCHSSDLYVYNNRRVIWLEGAFSEGGGEPTLGKLSHLLLANIDFIIASHLLLLLLLLLLCLLLIECCLPTCSLQTPSLLILLLHRLSAKHTNESPWALLFQWNMNNMPLNLYQSDCIVTFYGFKACRGRLGIKIGHTSSSAGLYIWK